MRGPHPDQRHRSGRRGGVHVHGAEPVRRGHLHRLHQPRGRQGRQEEQVGQQAQQERQPEAGRRSAAAATTAGGLHATAAATTVVYAATAGEQIDTTFSKRINNMYRDALKGSSQFVRTWVEKIVLSYLQ